MEGKNIYKVIDKRGFSKCVSFYYCDPSEIQRICPNPWEKPTQIDLDSLRKFLEKHNEVVQDLKSAREILEQLKA